MFRSRTSIMLFVSLLSLALVPNLARAQNVPNSAPYHVFVPMVSGNKAANTIQDTTTNQELEVARLTNEFRAKNGCPALNVSPELVAAAHEHSADMAQKDYLSHQGSDGSQPWDRMEQAGYRWLSAGENIALGYASADQAVSGWEGSSAHRKNMLTCNFTDIGVGYVVDGNGTPYWTQVFGSR